MDERGPGPGPGPEPEQGLAAEGTRGHIHGYVMGREWGGGGERGEAGKGRERELGIDWEWLNGNGNER